MANAPERASGPAVAGRSTASAVLRWLLAGVGLLVVAGALLLIGAIAAQLVFAVAGA